MMLRTLLAGILVLSFARAIAAPIEVTLHQRNQGYFNSGTFTLRDPLTNEVMGKYEFITGGCGRGAAPFGTYEVGEYQGTDDDPLNIGPRWLIHHVGMQDGDAQDPRYTVKRTELELHSLHPGRWKCTLGCVGIDGGAEVYARFMTHLRYILGTLDYPQFILAGNPDAPDVEAVAYVAPKIERVGRRSERIHRGHRAHYTRRRHRR